MSLDIEKLRFPVGTFTAPTPIEVSHLEVWKKDIAAFPQRVVDTIKELSEEQLDWIYRPGGWSIKQVIHHCADSHMNSFIRFKLSLTEDTPTIKPYMENLWAEMPDTTEVKIEESIKILEGLHARWTVLLNALSKGDLEKAFIHPEHGTRFTVAENMGVYAWHCNHHLAHIQQAIQHKGVFSPI